MFFWGGMTIVVWALAISRIARLARDRGRLVAGWVLGATVASVLGGFAAFELARRGADSDSTTVLAVLVMVAPALLIFGPMGAVVLVLYRAPIRVSQHDEWPVHFLDHGPGRISIDAGAVHFVWADGSRDTTLDQLRGAEADGESVRIACANGGDEIEIVVLPLGKPETPAGRRQQSQALAQRLRVKLPGARVVTRR